MSSVKSSDDIHWATNLYQNYIKAYSAANPNLSKEILLKTGQNSWNALKSSKKVRIEDRSKIEKEIESMKRKANEVNINKKLYWSKVFKNVSQLQTNEVTEEVSPEKIESE